MAASYPRSKVLRIRISRSLYVSLCEMLQAGRADGLRSSESLATELVERGIAEFRLSRIRPSHPLDSLKEKGAPAPRQNGNAVHRRPFTAAEVQRILFVKSREPQLPVLALAKRFHRSPTDVYKILRRYLPGSSERQA